MPHPRYEFQAALSAAFLVSGAGQARYYPPAFGHPPREKGRVPFRCYAAIPSVAASGGPPGDIAAGRYAPAGIYAPQFLRNLARCAAAPGGAQLSLRPVGYYNRMRGRRDVTLAPHFITSPAIFAPD